MTDNSNAPPREDPGLNKIYRVRQFLGFVLRNFQRLYRLDREVSIDETMVPTRGAFHSNSTLRTNLNVGNKTMGALRSQDRLCF